MHRLVLFLAMVALTTCPAAQTNSQEAWRAQQKIIDEDFRQGLAQNSVLDRIRNKMALFNTSEQTFWMLVDTTTPSPEEQEAIQRYARLREHYMARYAENDARFDNPLRHIRQRRATALSSLLADLHNGQLTYGEYAKRRQTIADSTYQEQLRASQSAEAAHREQEARNQEAARLDQEAADRRNQLLLETGRALLQRPNSGSAGAVGFFKRDYVSGFNRICLYDRLGSAVALTISATASCPLNIP